MRLPAKVTAWLTERPDDHVLSALFGAVLVATVSVLGLDYYEMANAPEPAIMPAGTPEPALQPGAQPLPARKNGDRRSAPLRRPDAKLGGKMTFELVDGGRLLATGTIAPGTAEIFAAEVQKRASYIKTVVLHSPGGSVGDALEMGRLIRAKKFATEVENGAYCASSCPLVFAGGLERRAGEKAAIGVHQVYAATDVGSDGMEHAQRVSAECQRYLREMGIDLEVWVHAMETPKEQLFYFKPDELISLKLATQRGTPPPTAKAS
jgi:hypothetical protein